MVDTRVLTASTSFPETATEWAKTVGLLDVNGDTVSTFPSIIGVPEGALNLGAFNIGLIGDSRDIKQAFQDLETATSNRLLKSSNLADLTDRAAARTNLQLGTAATWAVGTTGAVIPLLSTTNTWSAVQAFGAGASATGTFGVSGAAGTIGALSYYSGAAARWSVFKDSNAESGSNVGSDFVIGRYNDAGTVIDRPFVIARNTGTISLSQPLPITSGGTGGTSQSSAKTALGLGNVNNTADTDKPVSTATQTALNAKLNNSGGTILGTLNVGVDSGNSIAITSDGAIEMQKSDGSPYIDFKSGTQDYQIRLMANCTTTTLSTTANFVSDGTGKVMSALLVGSPGSSTEGAQITLGYKNNPNLTVDGNNTWNIDVDTNNAFRIYRINSSGVWSTPITIAENGTTGFASNVIVNGSGILGSFIGTGSANQGLSIRNNYGSSSVASNSFLDFHNENGISTSSITIDHATNGSSQISVNTTPSGSRTVDRRSNVVVFSNTSAGFSVPVTTPQISVGSSGTGNSIIVGANSKIGDISVANTLSVRGQSDENSGFIRFGASTSGLGCSTGSATLSYGGNSIWHAGNDGSGSGLDADLLDGIQSTSFLRNTVDTWITDSTGAPRLNFQTSNNTYIRAVTGIIFRNGSDTDIASIDVSGNFTAAGNISAYSDARLKTNVKTIVDGMDIVRRLRGVYFDKDGSHQVGLIAQEVMESLPQVVIETKTPEKLLSVAYGNIVGVLVEALKSMDERLTAIEEKLAL